jgi:hypothetical protein
VQLRGDRSALGADRGGLGRSSGCGGERWATVGPRGRDEDREHAE